MWQVVWSSDSATGTAGWELALPHSPRGWVVPAWYPRLPCQSQAEGTGEMLGRCFPIMAVPCVGCPVFDSGSGDGECLHLLLPADGAGNPPFERSPDSEGGGCC